MQQLEHPASEQRIVRASRGLEQRVAEDWDGVGLSLQSLAERREQLGQRPATRLVLCSYGGTVRSLITGPEFKLALPHHRPW